MLLRAAANVMGSRALRPNSGSFMYLVVNSVRGKPAPRRWPATEAIRSESSSAPLEFVRPLGAQRRPYFFSCHPEVRAFCGPKDLWSCREYRRCQQSASVLRRQTTAPQDDSVRGRYKAMARGFRSEVRGSLFRGGVGRAFLLVILRSALFAGRRIYGVVESISAASRVH
jgi:hypothetical protein